ncbi:hypothetical protein [Myxosarcina sp. GI1(2024)]
MAKLSRANKLKYEKKLKDYKEELETKEEEEKILGKRTYLHTPCSNEFKRMIEAVAQIESSSMAEVARRVLTSYARKEHNLAPLDFRADKLVNAIGTPTELIKQRQQLKQEVENLKHSNLVYKNKVGEARKLFQQITNTSAPF